MFSLEDNRKVAYDVIIIVSVARTMGIFTLFDLKGLKTARQELKDEATSDVSGLQRKRKYKDLDFLQTVKRVDLSDDDRKYLRSTLKGDVEMLTSMNVTDNAMLLVFIPKLSDHKFYLFGQGWCILSRRHRLFASL